MFFQWSWDAAVALIGPLLVKLHACLSHEKGCEDLFKVWRRCVKKFTENGIVRADR